MGIHIIAINFQPPKLERLLMEFLDLFGQIRLNSVTTTSRVLCRTLLIFTLFVQQTCDSLVKRSYQLLFCDRGFFRDRSSVSELGSRQCNISSFGHDYQHQLIRSAYAISSPTVLENRLFSSRAAHSVFNDPPSDF